MKRKQVLCVRDLSTELTDDHTPILRIQIKHLSNFLISLPRFVRERFPYLDSSAPSISETCMYTLTPDWNFVIGRARPIVSETATAATSTAAAEKFPMASASGSGDVTPNISNSLNGLKMNGSADGIEKAKDGATDDGNLEDGDVIYAVGFSGQGFKMAPAVGEMLADLAEGKPTKFDVKNFAPNRFSSEVGEK